MKRYIFAEGKYGIVKTVSPRTFSLLLGFVEVNVHAHVDVYPLKSFLLEYLSTRVHCRISLDINFLAHAYQSLACETTINTEFGELFSLKRIYVIYKNAILSHIDCFFRT